MNLTMKLNSKSIFLWIFAQKGIVLDVYAPFQGRAKAMAREERRMEENTKTVIQMALII